LIFTRYFQWVDFRSQLGVIIAFYRKYADENGLPLILGIGAVFLATATPAEVTQRVRHYLEVGGENGRFVLYLCNLGATTPAVNVRAAVAAVRKYGAY
jgi:uroporphyrinogen-III decarboxylase